MPNYKHYMNHGFAGCRLLAESYDPYRQRDVKIYLMPSIDNGVGVTDGTDSWIAPIVADLFRVDILKLVKAVEAGENPAVVRNTSLNRKRVTLEEAPQPVRRERKALVDAAVAEANTILTRSRRVLA